MTTIERPRATDNAKPMTHPRGDTKLPPTKAQSKPKREASGDSNHTSSQISTGAQAAPRAAGANFLDSQRNCESQKAPAVGDQTLRTGHNILDSQLVDAGSGLDHPPTMQIPKTKVVASAGSTSTDSHVMLDTQRCHAVRGPLLADPILGLSAEVLDDLEMVRIANENRLRTLTATDEYGFGLTLEHPDVARLSALVDSLVKAEHQAVLNLQRVMKNHPLGPWVDGQKGIGYKQAARLLAVIRDPYWNELHNRPRTVSELWAFCGLHVLHTGDQSDLGNQPMHVAGVAPRHQRGQKSNWNEDARKRAWLISASCIKQTPEASAYRTVYDAARTKYVDTLHPADCIRCGPKGKPALAGSPLSAGHQHARAMRLMSKAILKDLWLEAKRIHEGVSV